MKNLLIIIILTTTINVSFGQSFYEIKELGTIYSAQQIDSAFQSADFCGSFFITKRNVLVMNDGAIVELKSRQELTSAAQWTLGEFCSINDNETYYEAIWSIHPSGKLLKGFDTEKYPSEKEYLHYTNN
ncbi:MAG: hypothetical protein QNL61_06965 [Crocinitomicaceae bacterium]